MILTSGGGVIIRVCINVANRSPDPATASSSSTYPTAAVNEMLSDVIEIVIHYYSYQIE